MPAAAKSSNTGITITRRSGASGAGRLMRPPEASASRTWLAPARETTRLEAGEHASLSFERRRDEAGRRQLAPYRVESDLRRELLDVLGQTIHLHPLRPEPSS